MNKFMIVVGVALSFLFSGCAAVIQGGAAMAAGSAKEHPANQSFTVSMNKNEAFNATLRALTAKGRKVTTSDREAGIVQGEFDDYAVTIKIAGKSGGAVVDITVAYNQAFIYGASQVEKVLTVLKGDIEAASNKKTASETQDATPANTAHKKAHAKVAAAQ